MGNGRLDLIKLCVNLPAPYLWYHTYGRLDLIKLCVNLQGGTGGAESSTDFQVPYIWPPYPVFQVVNTMQCAQGMMGIMGMITLI